jgi:hypothetical protein
MGYLSAAVARERSAGVPSLLTAGWRAAVVVALARLAILFGGPLLLRVNHSRPAGILLFLLVVTNSAFEARATGGFFGAQMFRDPSFLFAILIALTSIPLGFVWAWIRTRPRSGRARTDSAHGSTSLS